MGELPALPDRSLDCRLATLQMAAGERHLAFMSSDLARSQREQQRRLTGAVAGTGRGSVTKRDQHRGLCAA